MDILVVPFLLLLKAILGLAIWVVIADVIMNWLLIANVINPNNRFVMYIIETLSRISSIMLNPIRRYIPMTMGTIDLSPVVLILILTFLENVFTRILIKFM